MMMQMTKDQLNKIQRLYFAIEKLDMLISYYNKIGLDPAYITCNNYKGNNDPSVQIASEVFVSALVEQRARYISSLNELGIDYVVTQND